MNRKYDALYIFVGIAKDDALNANLEKALAEVARLGGTILSTESLGKRTFSRPMKKRESGVYVKVRFEMDPSKVAELVNRYKLVEEVFRVQILAVDERREAILADERARRQAEAEASAAHAAESTASRVAEGSDEAVQSGTVEEA